MRLYNTLTRQVEEVTPLEGGRVRMYTCGPTVYRYAHIGNFRTFLLADLVRRALAFQGYEVTQVLNITDVGHMTDESSTEAVDRMDRAAEDEGLSPTEIAKKYTEAFLNDSAALGIVPAHVYPRATEHIPQMLELTERLLERGHAYELDGTVYYDVLTFPDYGKLSRNTLDRLQPGHRDLETDPRKKHHADFSLWKAAAPGRLLKWDSPWGHGFPGWHIECSAMSMDYLGERFDIHTGGVDLVFPHHENEIAQSEGATGHRVVSTWVHGGHLRLRGQKIAKSTGNVVRVGDLAEQGIDPLSFRYLTFQTRYRSEMDFSLEAMSGADGKVKHLRQRVLEWADADPPGALSSGGDELDRRFREAVLDDLDMPAALRVLNEAVSARVPPGEKRSLVSSWDGVLGLDLDRLAREGFQLGPEVEELLRRRDEARAAGDYTTSDGIREQLTGMGLEVMDTPGGTKVRPRA